MVRRVKSKGEPEISRSVSTEKGIELLQEQIKEAEKLLANSPISIGDYSAWKNTTKDYLIRSFGSKSHNVNAVMRPPHATSLFRGMRDNEYEKYVASGLENQIKMLQSCIKQLNTKIELPKSDEAGNNQIIPQQLSNEVFIVHGHDQGVKDTVARFIEKLGLNPVILHEQPNKGRTIIEKFSDYSDVGFAVVLLTADDVGKKKQSPEELELRARQNVIFELGYFIGKLGRASVCALYEEGVKTPSDYQGVIFIPLDVNGKWKLDLSRELSEAGFDINTNGLIATA